MKPSELLEQHREEVRRIALSRGVSSVRVFGSVLHGTDTEGSDLDLLVEPTAQTSMFDIGGIQFEVSELLGIDVDVVTPRALHESFRQQVLAEATLL
ncbi:MAG: nucleotidyltransferase [Variovorax sp.]|nr:MAG: nucleotidyltransferase [Variovorax sp.]